MIKWDKISETANKELTSIPNLKGAPPHTGETKIKNRDEVCNKKLFREDLQRIKNI